MLFFSFFVLILEINSTDQREGGNPRKRNACTVNPDSGNAQSQCLSGNSNSIFSNAPKKKYSCNRAITTKTSQDVNEAPIIGGQGNCINFDFSSKELDIPFSFHGEDDTSKKKNDDVFPQSNSEKAMEQKEATKMGVFNVPEKCWQESNETSIVDSAIKVISAQNHYVIQDLKAKTRPLADLMTQKTLNSTTEQNIGRCNAHFASSDANYNDLALDPEQLRTEEKNINPKWDNFQDLYFRSIEEAHNLYETMGNSPTPSFLFSQKLHHFDQCLQQNHPCSLNEFTGEQSLVGSALQEASFEGSSFIQPSNVSNTTMGPESVFPMQTVTEPCFYYETDYNTNTNQTPNYLQDQGLNTQEMELLMPAPFPTTYPLKENTCPMNFPRATATWTPSSTGYVMKESTSHAAIQEEQSTLDLLSSRETGRNANYITATKNPTTAINQLSLRNYFESDSSIMNWKNNPLIATNGCRTALLKKNSKPGLAATYATASNAAQSSADGQAIPTQLPMMEFIKKNLPSIKLPQVHRRSSRLASRQNSNGGTGPLMNLKSLKKGNCTYSQNQARIDLKEYGDSVNELAIVSGILLNSKDIFKIPFLFLVEFFFRLERCIVSDEGREFSSYSVKALQETTEEYLKVISQLFCCNQLQEMGEKDEYGSKESIFNLVNSINEYCADPISAYNIDFMFLEDDSENIEELGQLMAIKEEQLYKKLNIDENIYSIFKNCFSEDDFDEKGEVTNPDIIFRCLLSLMRIFNLENCTMNISLFSDFKPLIEYHSKLFFKVHLKLKILLIPEFATLKQNLPMMTKAFNSQKIKHYLLMLYSLSSLNRLFERLSRSQRNRFLDTPNFRVARHRYALYVLFIRELLIATFLQSMEIKGLVLFKYIYYARCDFLFMLSGRDSHLCMENKKFNHMNVIFFMFFDFIGNIDYQHISLEGLKKISDLNKTQYDEIELYIIGEVVKIFDISLIKIIECMLGMKLGLPDIRNSSNYPPLVLKKQNEYLNGLKILYFS